MPPKYYCDYCDKQFHDTPAARRRHSQGSSHQRAKKLWFDSFKDPEDLKRGTCSYFMRTGTCQYGQNCRYSHPVLPGLLNLGDVPTDINISQQNLLPHSASPVVVSLDVLHGRVPAVTESKLPPSLQPPPEGGYPNLPRVDWG